MVVSGRPLLNVERKAFGGDWYLQIEVRVGVFLRSGLVLDEFFRLHDGFEHIFKNGWVGGWGGWVWRLIEYCILGWLECVV